MPNPINPYAAPQTESRLELNGQAAIKFPSHSLSLMAITALIGGFVTALSIFAIYVDDPRTGTRNGPTLEFSVCAGAGLSSVIWLISGFFQRRGILGLIETCALAAVFAAGWILVTGSTYADVLGAAACVGWPLGGFVASIASYRFACWKFKCASRLTEKVDG